MMVQEFKIPQRLPSLNDVIAANRSSPYKGAGLKKKTDETIQRCILDVDLKPVTNPCIVLMKFIEADRRRDIDNVESAKKFILDALVKSGVLRGDSPRYVVGAPSYTEYGEAPRVYVTIIEGADEKALKRRLKQSAENLTGEEQ